MSYVFPKHRIKPNTPMDYEEVNENFQDLIGETSGALNEHNFNRNTFTDSVAVAQVAPMLCWWDASVVINPGFDCGSIWEMDSPPGTQINTTSAPFLTDEPDLFYQQVQGSWEVITGLTKTITATGGVYWALASFQHDGRSKYLEDGEKEWFFNHYGALYALRVNGRVIHETITGGAHNNPIVAQGTVEAGTAISPVHPKIRVTNTGEKVFDTHAIHGDTGLLPVALDFVLDLPPGTHVIDVVMQTLPHPQPGNVSVSNRELIILEMRA